MKKEKIFYFIILFTLFTSFKNVGNNLKFMNIINNDWKNLIKVDSFQLCINQYCILNKSIDSITNLINLTKLNENERGKIINGLNSQITSYNSFRQNIIDNLRPGEIDKKVKIVYFDSLIFYSNRSISLLEKLSNKNELIKLENSKTLKESQLKLILYSLERYKNKITGSKEITFKGIKYYFFVANLDSNIIRMHLFIPHQQNKNFFNIGNVKDFLEKQNIKPLMITNAGMYTPSHEPEGLYIEEDSLIKNYVLDNGKNNPDLNFYLKPNGVFYIDQLGIPHIDTTEEFDRLHKSGKMKIKVATQSGPMLVINGRIHQSFAKGSPNKKIRSGVGIINEKKIIFVITQNESTFYDFANFFRDIFNCKNALFLDGAISKMYLYDINPKETGGEFGPIISVSKKNKK